VRAMTATGNGTVLTQGDNGLFSVDLSTGYTQLVGQQLTPLYGLDFGPSGLLYGLSDQGRIFWVSRYDSTLALVRDTGDQFWLDLTVPDVQNGPPPCYPDFDGNGTLDLFDFLAFVNAFNAHQNKADCDHNGSWDLFDFLCFTNAFNAGC